jgi:FkbM family methyltransferase
MLDTAITLRVDARIPVSIDCPPQMASAVQYVLEGEYESGHDGAGLSILDIGANVGSFAVWADRRWPGSTITCFEPNPGTFAYLERNTRTAGNIVRHNAALFPRGPKRQPFVARYAGDGEAGLAAYAGDTFIASAAIPVFSVDVVHPDTVGSADIVKIDIEGGEAEVLAALDLSGTSLVLAEFQNSRNRDAMRATLTGAGFVACLDEACPWDPILDYRDYRADLAGNVYGRMFYERIGQTRLTVASRPKDTSPTA